MKRTLSTIAATVALLTTAVVGAPPAQAHGVDIYNGNDYAHMGADHLNAWVHDRECDGNAVYVVARFGPNNATKNTWDQNGCGSDGGTALGAPQGPYAYTAFRTCERAVGQPILGDPCAGSGNAWHTA